MSTTYYRMKNEFHSGAGNLEKMIGKASRLADFSYLYTMPVPVEPLYYIEETI